MVSSLGLQSLAKSRQLRNVLLWRARGSRPDAGWWISRARPVHLMGVLGHIRMDFSSCKRVRSNDAAGSFQAAHRRSRGLNPTPILIQNETAMQCNVVVRDGTDGMHAVHELKDDLHVLGWIGSSGGVARMNRTARGKPPGESASCRF